MRNLTLLILIVLTSCQTANIKNDNYKISNTNVELGCIGQAKLSIDQENKFETKTVAKLDSKIRLSIEIIPFDKKLYNAYQKRGKLNQNLNPIKYIDSISKKPELALIRLMDVAGFVKELNADYNKLSFSLIRDTKEVKVASSVAVTLSNQDLEKIRLADSYYLINNQDQRYTVALYKQGKKTDVIDVNSAVVIAYRLSSFCWAAKGNNWYIADMAEGTSTCKGNTSAQITEKQEVKNLYKM